MNRCDPIQDDLRTLNHEAGHALAVELLGGHVVLVRGHRNVARNDTERGSCEWYGVDDPFAEATVLLAGRAAAEGFAALVDAGTDDEVRAAAVCPLGLEKARRRAQMLFLGRRPRRALTALALGLADAGHILTGPEVRRVIAEALADPA